MYNITKKSVRKKQVDKIKKSKKEAKKTHLTIKKLVIQINKILLGIIQKNYKY